MHFKIKIQTTFGREGIIPKIVLQIRKNATILGQASWKKKYFI